MKDAVTARNAFASAHSYYTMSLKNTGAALSDFAQGESSFPQSQNPNVTSQANPNNSASGTNLNSSAVQPPIESLPPPPPPLPDFSPSPLQRAVSMPEIPKKFQHVKMTPMDSAILEDDDEHVVEKVAERKKESVPEKVASPAKPEFAAPPQPESTWDYFFANYEGMTGEIEEPVTPEKAPPPPPPVEEMVTPAMTPEVTPENVVKSKVVHHQHAASASAVENVKKERNVNGVGEKKKGVASVSLLQVLEQLDDHFLKASESAQEVSKMLEANRMHYHSNFADNRGHIDHSARVMRVITWNRSFKGMHNADDGKDDFDNDESETHATVLDKMLAWEKKLYEEVKVGELMKIEYQRKVALLSKQKKRNVNPESIEKTKAAVSHLHTRYIVDMQSMDSTVQEIQRLRDDQLFPKLVELVNGMAAMWESMCTHHDAQLKIVTDIRSLDISTTIRETTEHHHGRTLQLHDVVRDWYTHFDKLITHQREYVQFLNSWLKLNLIPIESNLKEKVSSPPRIHHPPIQSLLASWNEHMEKLPNELAKNAIQSFSAVINTIKIQQEEEIKQKEKCEETHKEYLKKSKAFQDWYSKHGQRIAENSVEGGENAKDLVAERKFVVDSLKTRLDSEVEEHQKLCRQVREKSLGSLKSHLPELFRAISDFALASSDMYKSLGSISMSPDHSEAN